MRSDGEREHPEEDILAHEATRLVALPEWLGRVHHGRDGEGEEQRRVYRIVLYLTAKAARHLRDAVDHEQRSPTGRVLLVVEHPFLHSVQAAAPPPLLQLILQHVALLIQVVDVIGQPNRSGISLAL